MKIAVTILIVLMVLIPQYLFANDGFASLGVGGVTIAKTNAIAIKHETLDISYDKIQVSYDFINESDQNENAVVMFPLPPYPANPSESLIISHGQPSGFTIVANGKSVTYDTEVKATLKGRDVTDVLKSVGFSLKQIALFPFDETLLKDHELQISKKQIQALTEKGLVVHGIPKWNINVTYVWKQFFPSKSIVHIEHTYRPFIAEGTAGGYSGHDRDVSRTIHSWGLKDVFDFCPTDDQIQKLDRMLSNSENLDSHGQVPGTIVEYILTTANSWKDGIRDFKLRIHTKSKNEIVALCFPSKIAKVSDLLYESNLQNFEPKSELSIYFGNVRNFKSNGYGEPPHF